MKRFLCVVMGLGVLAAFGGVGFLYWQNYNVFSARLWSAAFRGMIDQPLALVEALDDPARRGLAAGLLTTSGGISLFLGSLVLLNVYLLAMSLVGLVKKVRAKNVSVDGPKPRRARETQPGRKFEFPKFRFPKLSKGGFRDEMADLESGPKSRRLKDLVAKIKGLFPARKVKRTTQVVISSGKEKTVLAEITEDTEFYADLKSWHKRVKASSGADLSLIEEAKALRDRRTKAVAEAVLNEDPMNGEFLMRMMAAWAEKSMNPVQSPKAPEVVRPAGPDEVMSAAIDDVMRNGVEEDEDESEGIDLDDESFLPEHLFEDLDEAERDKDDGEDLDDPASMLDIDPTEDRDIDLDDDDGEGFLNPELFGDDGDDDADAAPSDGSEEGDPAGGEMSAEESLESDLKAIRELITTVADIEQGIGEWPVYLQDEADRVAQLERAIMSISEQIEMAAPETLKAWLDDNAGSPEWDWLAENLDRLDEERRDILETIVEGGSAGMPADDDEEESVVVDAASGEDEIDDWSVAGTTASVKNDPDPEVEPTADEGVSAADAAPDQPDDIPDDELPEATAGTQSENTVKDEEGSSENEPEISGQDLSLDQLAEVEMCDDLLTKWGYSARGAGASEAKLVHTIVAKNGVKRKVVGVVHMVAGWKGSAPKDNRRLNVIFRYVPEGNWRFEAGDGIRFVDDRENFVSVSQELLDHPEMASQKAVIHFYGPGVQGELREEVSDRVLVVGSALNTEEVTDLVFG